MATVISLPVSQNLCVRWGIACKEGDGSQDTKLPLTQGWFLVVWGNWEITDIQWSHSGCV